MENLRRNVFNELNNYPIASTNQSSSTTSPLETTRAYKISWAFFMNMVDPVCDRVHAIIHAHANLSAVQAATAKAQHQDSATPEVVGDMDRNLPRFWAPTPGQRPSRRSGIRSSFTAWTNAGATLTDWSATAR